MHSKKYLDNKHGILNSSYIWKYFENYIIQVTETTAITKSRKESDTAITNRKYYYYADQYDENFSREKDIIDAKHCRRGGLPNATETCNEGKCPGNNI